jgi:hypothetical protein
LKRKRWCGVWGKNGWNGSLYIAFTLKNSVVPA